MTYTKEDIQNHFIQLITEEQGIAATEVDVHASFQTFGLDSISSIYLLDKLEDHFGVELNPIEFFDYPTIEQFSTYLLEVKLRT